jgi:hypothetical protein
MSRGVGQRHYILPYSGVIRLMSGIDIVEFPVSVEYNFVL